ncbi:MAG: hypothetical protein DRQ35_05335 [Gammaproteobacteria bacterium]|nr:MAG: hypothetical protein DRQ35_05335 [Gammaproteobacteria bacterium]
MSNLILIRGLSGSGKSTLAEHLAEFYKDIHLETDQWFTNDSGLYTFLPSMLGENHQACLDNTKAMLDTGQDVIVSNTFSKLWEIQKYVDLLGEQHRLTIYECKNEFGNTHNVPDAVILNMAERWDNVFTDGTDAYLVTNDSLVEKDYTSFRLYADGNVVHEDDFEECDNSQPYYDDYGTYDVPNAIIDHITS